MTRRLHGRDRKYNWTVPTAADVTVAILLCTHQGHEFLSDQLESIAAQTYAHWFVFASDDASSDGTVEMLDRYRAAWGGDRLRIVAGPARGLAANFRAVTCCQSIVADAFAYADQDDIWEADKLERAVRWLREVPAGMPALYCSRTRLVDRENRAVGLSPLFGRTPSFANALTQNLAGGNTMVFNQAARRLLIEADEAGAVAVIHDWWAYLLISGCGGRVHYDPIPTVRYRQHGGNQVGSNARVLDQLSSVTSMVRGRLRDWNDRNTEAIGAVASRLTPANQRILNRFLEARRRGLLPRLVGLWRSGVYRQTPTGNLGFLIAALLNRI